MSNVIPAHAGYALVRQHNDASGYHSHSLPLEECPTERGGFGTAWSTGVEPPRYTGKFDVR